MARRHFGTDGVRGIVGESLTPELVERLGRAATLGGARAGPRRPRHARLRAGARGGASSAASSRRAGSPCSAACCRRRPWRCSPRTSASSSPPPTTRPSTTASSSSMTRAGSSPMRRGGDRGVIDDARRQRSGSVEPRTAPSTGYVDHVLDHFGSTLAASGSRSTARTARTRHRARRVRAARRRGDGDREAPDGDEHQRRLRRHRPGLLQEVVRAGGHDLGIAFDGDGDRMLAVDETGEALDGDQIVAVLALALGVDKVAVTVMANLGFHRLMEERGYPRAHDRRRRPVRARGAARRGRGARRRAVGSHHLARRPRHGRRSRRRAAALRGARRGLARRRRSGDGAAAAGQGERPRHAARGLAGASRARSRGSPSELAGRGRILVRPSGTEPLIRVLAEAETEEEAANLCGRVAHLVRSELGQ